MDEHDRTCGFTLIEVLVALAVFSMAAMGLAHLTTETVRGAGHIDLRVLAKIEADNQMVAALIQADKTIPAAAAGRTEQRGQQLDWTRTVSPTGRANLIAVSVIVIDPESRQHLAEVHTLASVTP